MSTVALEDIGLSLFCVTITKYPGKTAFEEKSFISLRALEAKSPS